MKAVILAGGEGTRLRPLTSNQPKPMMPIANRPMMEHIVRLLADHGFDQIVVTVAFLANQIRTYFGDGSELGVEMRYATEDTPLGTAGSVRNAAEELDDTFLVISGDVLTDVDLTGLIKAHRAIGRARHHRVEAGRRPGRVRHRDHPRRRIASSGSSRSPRGARCSPTPSTPGIYVLEPRIFDFIAADEIVDFSSDVFPAALEAGEPLYGHVDRGVLGGRRHARRLPARPPGHPRRPGERRDRRLPDAGERVARRRRGCRSRCAGRRSRDHRAELPDRAGRARG